MHHKPILEKLFWYVMLNRWKSDELWHKLHFEGEAIYKNKYFDHTYLKKKRYNIVLKNY
jgi:hypothetical protein